MINWSRMSAISFVGMVVAGAYVNGHAAAMQDAAPTRQLTTHPLARATAPPTRALLDKYCVTCHNERLKAAGLMLDRLDPARVDGAADVWEKVVRKLRTHEMPPPGRPRPDLAAYAAAAMSLETSLDQASAAHLNPGRVG